MPHYTKALWYNQVLVWLTALYVGNIITWMSSTPNPPEVLGLLEPVTASLRTVLHKSVKRARSFLHSRGEWDPFYFATRIRFEARCFLRLQSLETLEDPDETTTPEFESNRLPNIGLQFFHRGVLAKVLKRSSDPDIPLPVPSSRRRIGFYNQQRQIVPRRAASNEVRLSELNTLYLWDCDDSRKLSYFALACPKTGGKNKQLVSWHWIINLPLLSVGQPQVNYGEEDRTITLSEDILEIRRPEEETGPETGTDQTL